MQTRGGVLNESMPNIASLNQTKARYQKIINDLTGGGAVGGSRQPTSPEEASFSDGQRRSSSLTGNEQPMLAAGAEGESLDATPQEIRDYVRQFKLEVEEKFSQSQTNRAYQFPFKKIAKDHKSGDNDDSRLESSLKSLLEISRYDLRSQNIFERFVQARLTASGKSSVDYDASILVEMLREIGRIDKESLKCQLQSSQSNIIKALLATLEDKFLSEIDKRRTKDGYSSKVSSLVPTSGLEKVINSNSRNHGFAAASTTSPQSRGGDPRLKIEQPDDSKQSRDQSVDDPGLEEDETRFVQNKLGFKDMKGRGTKRLDDYTGNMQTQASSDENIHILNGNNESKLRTVKTTGQLKYRKSQETGSSLDIVKPKHFGTKRLQKADKERAGTDRNGQTSSQEFLKESLGKDLLPRSKSNNNYISTSRESTEQVEVYKTTKKHSQAAHVKSSLGATAGIPVSPRGTAGLAKPSVIGPPRKNRPSLISKTQKHSTNNLSNQANNFQQTGLFAGSKVGTGVLSPTKINTIAAAAGTNYGLAKFSNHTILTANTLTSTLSPKSNMSSHTAKSASKKRPKKLAAGIVGGASMSAERDGVQPMLGHSGFQQGYSTAAAPSFPISSVFNGTNFSATQSRGASNQSGYGGNGQSSRRQIGQATLGGGMSPFPTGNSGAGSSRLGAGSTQHLGLSSAQLANKIKRAIAEDSTGVLRPSLAAAAATFSGTATSSKHGFGSKGLQTMGSKNGAEQLVNKKAREVSSSTGRGNSHSRTGILSPTFSASQRGPASSRFINQASARQQLRESSSGAKQESGKKRKARVMAEGLASGGSSGGTSTLQHILLGTSAEQPQLQPLSRVNWKRRAEHLA